MEATIISLTKPAVRYAVETSEIYKNYRVAICVKTEEDANKFFEMALDFFDMAQISKVVDRSVFLKNGSVVSVYPVHTASKGRRSNLIVYDTRLSNRVVSSILQPMLIHYFE